MPKGDVLNIYSIAYIAYKIQPLSNLNTPLNIPYYNI